MDTVIIVHGGAGAWKLDSLRLAAGMEACVAAAARGWGDAEAASGENAATAAARAEACRRFYTGEAAPQSEG